MRHRRLRVRLETARHVIEGTVQLPGEGYRSRITDFLNAQETDFLAVTDAELGRIGEEHTPEAHPYLAVSVRHVILVAELESLGWVDETSEPPTDAVLAISTPPPAG